MVESCVADSKKAIVVLEELRSKYGVIKHYLKFSNPLELLVAAILSPQVRDEVVNASTPALFKKFRSAKEYSQASVKDLLEYVSKVSFAGKKAEHIIGACKVLVEKHNGQVPRTLDDLMDLPGVGKKTAIVILSHAFNITKGVAVDTHVLRVAYRLGWTSSNKNADKVEEEMRRLIPERWWKLVPLLLKAHGRETCQAPLPYCNKCVVAKLCPKIGVKEKV